MNKQVTAWAILILTMLFPFKMAYLNDDGDTGVKLLMMVLTMAGVIISLFVGMKKAGE